jgi:hypothetical protein
MQLTRPRRRRPQRPAITPLSPSDDIAVRKALIELAFAAWEHADSWATAERLALDTLDSLRGDGLHVLRVTWTR